MNGTRTPPAAVVFDLDDTLTLDNSLYLTAGRLGTDLPALATLIHDAHNGEVSELAHRFFSLLTSRTPTVTRTMLTDAFAAVRLRPEAVPLVAALQATGHPVALISSSFDLYVAAMAQRLGVDDSYSNIHLRFDPGGVLVRTDLTVSGDQLKHRQLHDFCRRHRLDPARVLAVGDNVNDLGLFTCTGNGVLLHNAANSSLRPHARHVMTDLRDITTLFPPTVQAAVQRALKQEAG
ncbi:HAD-IB family phosphatase [Streptomyces sp. BHT-5-2]|uniref:HAD family hydrolase n=1 Tax=Streptomyces sp. BHT-5-2 TaxID=2866715 RepID=UPI001C8E8F14|nr:HAD-IB family phosphatase [Streptomyces sp. BHT-5-2]QZL04328.1 HAD-IB family phosphatase [Streptomyces sp. BHT-5-2]